ncbi:outer membrane protein assembly factor BamB family protein [Streptomyces sp. NBC_01439]|uniref:outer membrane protein assembly factor BamB family protein n=1 Tax=Streptomyces sp. NBC_01439 TaxID=2903867 RepID=UPI002E2BD1ED|nr:PQQ-binding-like beta-propeller repeat protein [Streptomyces sp. NBC_01439]
MTELPQPPNQPPAPSGYGHLPGPPQQGYGFPPQGENPYAQQPAYPPQPPTVAQQRPAGPGGPGSGSGPASSKKNKPIVLVAAAVAAALVLGGVGYAAFSGDDGDPEPVAQQPADAEPSGSPSVDKGDGKGDHEDLKADFNAGRKQGEDKVLWLKTIKVNGPGAGVFSKGHWIFGDTIAKPVGKTITGYAVADGKEKWTINFPGQICGTTNGKTTDDGKAVFMYRNGDSDDADCNQIQMIDLKAGKAGWSKQVSKESTFDVFLDAELALTGDTVTVNRLTRATAFRVSTGDQLFASPAEGCIPGRYAAGSGKLLGIATCFDADATVEIQDADPVTGKKNWTHRLPKGWRVNRVYSLDPIVLHIEDESTNERPIVVLGPDGQKRATLSAEGKFSIHCSSAHDDTLQGCATAVADAGTLYLPTTVDLGEANEIVAFDLTTGKAKWRVPAGKARTIVPLKAANGQLIAYRKAEMDQGGEVLSIPAAGGTPTTLLRHPSGPSAPVESTFFSPKVDYVDGRFFISTYRLLAQDTEEKLLMAFGK